MKAGCRCPLLLSRLLRALTSGTRLVSTVARILICLWMKFEMTLLKLACRLCSSVLTLIAALRTFLNSWLVLWGGTSVVAAAEYVGVRMRLLSVE